MLPWHQHGRCYCFFYDVHFGAKLLHCSDVSGDILNSVFLFKDVRAHCYCASLVRKLFFRHARATSFSSACTKSKTQQNVTLMTFALTWCANSFVGCSVTPLFFGRSLPFVILSIILKKKNLYVGSFSYFRI